MRLVEITSPPNVDVSTLDTLLRGNQTRAEVRRSVQRATGALVTIVSNKGIERNSVGLNAYYDFDDGTIEITLIFNPADSSIVWSKQNRELFMHELHDALKHELLHAKQRGNYRSRDEYLTNPNEIEAYAMNIADQLTRKVGKEKALHLLRSAKETAQLKDNVGNLLSPDLTAYVTGVDESTLHKLLKKVYQYLTKVQ